MSRASWVYVGFVGVLVVGLWAILTLGSMYATAPPDLAGAWDIDRPAAANTDAAKGDGMRIEQSGRYFELTLDDGRRLSLTLDKQGRDDSGRPVLSLSGGPWKATITRLGAPEDYDFHFDGPTPRAFRARRVESMYLPAGAAAPASPALPATSAGIDRPEKSTPANLSPASADSHALEH